MTKVIIKLFAGAFYRQHGAMVLFIFSTLLIYCFYINTLGDVELKEVTKWNLAVTLSIVSNPVMLAIFLFACIIYSFKSWYFFLQQILLHSNEFIFYSVNASLILNQLKTWFYVHFKIMGPLWIYSIFTLIIGFSYNYYVIPICINAFLFTLNLLLAFACIQKINRPKKSKTRGLIFAVGSSIKKPIYSLYFFQVIDKIKVVYVSTKLISLLISISVIYGFNQDTNSLRLAFTITLLMVSANSILIFNEYAFNERYLQFLHNFPISMFKRWIASCINYLFILLPELIWITLSFNLIVSIQLITFALSLILLLRSVVYCTGMIMRSYLSWFFIIFNLVFLAILYDILYFLLPALLLSSYLLFNYNYHSKKIVD